MSFRHPIFSWLAVAALSLPAAFAEDAAVEGEVIITFKASVKEEKAKNALMRHSLDLTQHYKGISRQRKKVSALVRGRGRSTREMIRDLKDDPEVEAVEPNYLRYVSSAIPKDTDYANLWGLSNTGQNVNATTGTRGVDVKFPAAWKLSRTPSPENEIVVAVVDTGVDITHPDLVKNIWRNPKEIPGNRIDDDGNGYIDDIHGYDFVKKSATMTDSGSHGTHVAGTIAAEEGNGIGLTGVHPHAKILPLKVSSDGDSMTTSAVLAALNYTILLKERGVNIVAVNASYGGASSTTAERTAVEALRDAGIIMCAAAGNDGVDNDRAAAYPASYTTSNVISVAAVNQNGGLSGFSNYGVTSVDIAAPGSNIFSSVPASESTATNVRVAGTSYPSSAVGYAGVTPSSGLSGLVYDCGLGRTADFPRGVSRNIALIQRGTTTFAEKVGNAASAGAVAAIIYDNAASPENLGGWSLGSEGNWIPVFQVTLASGQAILGRLTASAPSAIVSAYAVPGETYRFLNGTSMAAPHVSGAVAFAALNFPEDSMEQRIARILGNVTPLSALRGKVATGGMLNLLGLIDSDGGGLPDWWAPELPRSQTAAADDADGDGFSNLQEYLSGTEPSSPGSQPGFSDYGFEGSSFVLSYQGAPGLSYQVEWSDRPETGPWQRLGSPVSGSGIPVKVRDFTAKTASARRFYRLRLKTEPN